MQCTATYRELDKLGAAYTVVDISQDADARDYVMALGHLQAPVVVVDGDHWAGFRPDRIRRWPRPVPTRATSRSPIWKRSAC